MPINHPRTRTNATKDPKHDAKSKQKSPNESPPSKSDVTHVPNPKINGIVKENGHTRGAKSESDNIPGGWQKISKGKKKGTDGKTRSDVYPQSEQLPKNDSERKGG
jgi:hypothetical protein